MPVKWIVGAKPNVLGDYLMTLIIASATHKTQLLVADRQVTRADGRILNDTAYKIIQYVNHGQDYQCAVAYTGLAQVPGQGTLDWLMDILPTAMDSSTDLYFAIDNLRTTCTKELIPRMQSIPRRYRGITIVLCGRYNRFGAVGGQRQYIPFVAVISNCADKAGRQVDEVSDEFAAYSTRLLRRSSSISLCRGDLRAAARFVPELRYTFRYLRRDIPHTAKAKIATDFIRRVAQESNWTGGSILGLALTDPGIAEGFDFSVQTGSVAKTLPHLITDGGSRLTDFRVSPF